jgi:hypothetical protein
MAVVLLIALGVHTPLWKVALHSLSPDQTRSAVVSEACTGPDCSIQVEAKGGGWPVELAHRSDAWLAFAHIAWSPDSSRVGVYINLDYTEDIQAGYDFGNRAVLDGAEVKAMLAQSIARTYALTTSNLEAYEGDPLRWAESTEARMRYHDRFKRR